MVTFLTTKNWPNPEYMPLRKLYAVYEVASKQHRDELVQRAIIDHSSRVACAAADGKHFAEVIERLQSE